MKHKCFTICLALLAVFLLMGSALAEESGLPAGGTCGEGVTWQLNADGLLTIQGSGDMGYEGEAPWLAYADRIQGLQIEDGITSLGDLAFYGCQGLTSVTLPGSLESTGYYAFGNCKELKQVVLEPGIEEISSYCFSSCTGLESITIPASVNRVWHYAFASCAMKAVYLEDLAAWCDVNIHQIHDSPLAHTEALYVGGKAVTSLTIPEGVTSIFDTGFVGSRFIRELTLPSTMPRVGYRSFQECSGLERLVLKPGIREIENLAFFDCGKLKTVSFPEGLTRIGSSSFASCRSLTSALLPESVTRIEEEAFEYDRALSQVYIPAGVSYLGQNAFYGCSGLTDVYYGGSREQWDALAADAGVRAEAVIHCGARAPVEEEPLTGDLNGDGALNLVDVALLFRSLTGEGTSLSQGDVNGDGKCDLKDVALLYHRYVGLTEIP
ncbi:MAG: leucine-rich repeat protein [Oscillospiraceae bacterium]|nr:leucine-rich repeat protein [Oscillospiraceae bacterium]